MFSELLTFGSVYVETVIIAVLAAVLHVVAGWVIARANAQAKKTVAVWDSVIVYAISKPIYLLIWVVAGSYILQLLELKESKLLSIITTEGIRTIAIASVICWFSLRFVKEAENQLLSASHSRYSKLDKTTAQAISRLLKVFVIITTTLIVLPYLGVDTSNFLTFGAASTVVLGIASKDVLANFFGGFMIYFDRPFKVGDWISSSEKNIEGTVEYIGWRLTRIRNFEKRPIYVPNSVFNNISIINPSRMTNRRIKKLIGIRYDDAAKVPVILADIEKMLENHEDIDTNLIYFIKVEELGASSIDCRLYTFTKTTVWKEYVAIQQDVLLKCIEIIEGHGAEVAFPTTTLHVPNPIELEKAEQIEQTEQ